MECGEQPTKADLLIAKWNCCLLDGFFIQPDHPPAHETDPLRFA
jgi:hypothetical protein